MNFLFSRSARSFTIFRVLIPRSASQNSQNLHLPQNLRFITDRPILPHFLHHPKYFQFFPLARLYYYLKDLAPNYSLTILHCD